MKKLILIIAIFLTVFGNVVVAQESSTDEIFAKQQESLNINEIKNAIDKLSSPDSREIIPKFDLKKTIKDIAMGNVNIDLNNLLNSLIKFFFKEIYNNIHILIKVIVLVLLCAILQNLQSSFGKDGVGEIAFYACYIFICAILISSFMEVLGSGRQVIENMVLFMQSIVPAIFTLLITTGNMISSSILQPGIIFSIQIMSVIVKDIVLPLIVFYTVLAIVNNISNKVQVSKLAGLIKSIGLWTIGVFLTIFIGILSLQSKVAGLADGVTTRTAKFAVSTFVPIVGKILSDAVDTVLGYSMMLKNSITIVGMIVILLICLAPIIKLIALIIIYKLAAALIQPVSDERIVNCISEMANSLIFLLSAVITCAVMFLITISILLNIGIPTMAK